MSANIIENSEKGKVSLLKTRNKKETHDEEEDSLKEIIKS